MAKLTIDNIKKQLEPYGIEVLSKEFINSHEDLELKCNCGNTFKRTWNNLKRTIREGKNVACFECNKNNLGAYLRKTYEEVKKEIEDNGYTLLDREYKNAHEKLHMICPNGHDYKAEYWSFHQGHRCSCESVQHGVKHQEEYIRKKLLEYGFELIGEYVNAYTQMKLKCLKCGEINKLHWHSIDCCNVRCNNCKDNINSYGELRIKEFLKLNNIDYTEQKTFEECKDIRKLPFDFYLNEFNIAIEYDGEQHYKKCFNMTDEDFEDRKNKDNIKTQFCMDNNIYLIRIPYWDFDNIENILEKELLEKRSTTRA